MRELPGGLYFGEKKREADWASDLCVYTRPEKVWVDGALRYDANDPKRRPVSDFELGQPGSGDVK